MRCGSGVALIGATPRQPRWIAAASAAKKRSAWLRGVIAVEGRHLRMVAARRVVACGPPIRLCRAAAGQFHIGCKRVDPPHLMRIERIRDRGADARPRPRAADTAEERPQKARAAPKIGEDGERRPGQGNLFEDLQPADMGLEPSRGRRQRPHWHR